MTGGWTVVDALADPEAIVGADARLAFAEMIERLLTIHHEVSAATLRPALLADGWSRDHIDKRMGAMLTAALLFGAIQWTGRVTASGNATSRNAHRLVKVYTFGPGGARRVRAWVGGYDWQATHTRRAADTIKEEARNTGGDLA